MVSVAAGIRDVKLFIGGAFVPAADGQTFPSENPATGDVWATAALAGAEDAERAVAAAKRAFDSGPWPRIRVAERAAILRRISDGIMARREELARLESTDSGKPYRESYNFDVPRAAHNFHYFADYIEQVTSEAFPRDRDYLMYVERSPVGVAALITPWNFPLLLSTWKLAPCLAFGNTCVLKPAEQTPVTATLLAEIAAEAGLPEGVLNVVTGFGPDGVGEALTRHPDVRLISFTGETRTGAAIAAQAAPTLKRLSFELGGKSPNIVFADAELDEAVPGSLKAIYMNQGQVCLAGPRILVERPVYDEFMERFAAGAAALVVGDPLDGATQVGPLIGADHHAKVSSYMDLAREEGGRVLTGGGRPEGLTRGHYFAPTVLAGLRNEGRVCQEEIFGPVASVLSFTEEDEAIRIANDTRYGLAGMVWTQNLRRAHRVASALNAGTVWINCFFVRDLRVPFGGAKESGIGREGGVYSQEFFTEAKTVIASLTPEAILPPPLR